ncbi:Hypothetical predicted protein [Paramuricea clavata]|uniref:Uncharacterized protein n=1 Tax=Paramuricea clavata TaxID=317549 RepID=A0A7D9IVC7_PARCT|nr:Hypothetical predicted protein [Paramuricea clavata]
MAGNSLQEFREQLTLAYLSDVIDIEDFVYLYQTNQSREIFPYWKFDKFDFESWDDTECHKELRFRKSDIPKLLYCLGIPDKIICCQRTSCSGLEGLCILLKRLAYPCRYTDMISRFGRNPTEICLIFNRMLSLVFNAHHHRLESFEQPFLSPENLGRYADSIHAHGAPLQNCFGFIDGTVRRITRPNQNQRTLYNGYKRDHAMKFQSVVVPDGLIANLSGPYEGKRHDSTMLYQSGLLPLLEQHAFYNGVPLSLYGDPAYPLGIHLQGPFKDRQPTPEMELFNKAMSSVRVSVEWMFGSICNYFAFIDMKKQQKINLSAIGKFYSVSALLQNAHTCLYGNIVAHFFELSPPTLEHYFS